MLESSSTLVVLSSETCAASDRAFCKFAQFLGLATELVSLPGEQVSASPLAQFPGSSGARVLALGQATLRLLAGKAWFAKALDKARFILVYDFSPTDGESHELKWLTNGALTSVKPLPAGEMRFSVHSHPAFGDFPVSSKSYSVESGGATAFGGEAPAAGAEPCITVNGHPYCVTLKRGHSVLFLLAEKDLIDLDTVLLPDLPLRPWYAQLIAMAMFLRVSFGPACWTSPVTAAAFIVDDPYLRPRHGFLDYEMVLSEAKRTGAVLSLAFIPYNWRRSRSEVVSLVRRHADHFSMCVHGCDHTRGEFASLNKSWLTCTAVCAMARMEAHARRTRIPFDKVMVFPRGLFSTQALVALEKAGFTAVVNTTTWPVDYAGSCLTIRDSLAVAVTRHAGVPVFKRRYPRDIFDFAFDSLFQKPVLVGEHHGFFRQGCSEFVQWVGRISALSEKVAWMPLGEAVASSCVIKRDKDQLTVRHWSPVLRLQNPMPIDVSLSLEKPEPDARVEAVLIGGKPVPFEVQSGYLKYRAQLGAGELLNAEVIYRRACPLPCTTPCVFCKGAAVGAASAGPAPARRRPTWNYRFHVWARRIISDARVDLLAGSVRAVSYASNLKETLMRWRHDRTGKKGVGRPEQEAVRRQMAVGVSQRSVSLKGVALPPRHPIPIRSPRLPIQVGREGPSEKAAGLI